MNRKMISVSLLSADFSKLGEEIRWLNQSEVDWFHLDIMDGNFVPNLSYGFPVLKAISKESEKPLDAHLMICNPEKYIERFRDLNVSYLTIHYEAVVHLHRTIHMIRDMGVKAGVALNPHTPVHLLEDVISDLDMVCIMGVNPGFGGQKFIENTFKKIATLKKMIVGKKSKALIEVDGGVDFENVSRLMSLGADVLVAGSAIFDHPAPREAVSVLKRTKL